jgi:low temperature requirement protein LtrA
MALAHNEHDIVKLVLPVSLLDLIKLDIGELLILLLLDELEAHLEPDDLSQVRLRYISLIVAAGIIVLGVTEHGLEVDVVLLFDLLPKAPFEDPKESPAALFFLWDIIIVISGHLFTKETHTEKCCEAGLGILRNAY